MEITNGNILIVDDEPNALKVLSAILEEDGYRVEKADNVDDALDLISTSDFDAIITDLKMPGKDGMFLFDYVMENEPDIPVIFLTAFGTVESAVQAMNRGAYYYFVKPPNYTQLKGILARAVEQRRLKRELESMRRRLLEQGNHVNMIGSTAEMKRIFEIIDAVKESSSSVLITGETGTGKELIARSLHFNSSRRDKPFVPVNCAAIPKDLLESELFGYEKGAFTGATSRRIGKF
ncbi:MAG: sigma-54-dependent Fis family transcriptional regulator, partial [Nitrospirae bacterium]